MTIKQLGIIVAGWIVLVVGVVMIPYPGPGWLTVFAGLAILSREYHWARRVLAYARHKYDAWNEWIVRQPLYMRSLTFIGTSLVVIVTLWLLNAYGLLTEWFNVPYDWLRSPFV